MRSGEANLAYELYADEARSIVWDDSAGMRFVGTGLPARVPIYARIFAGQNVPAGSYVDTVTVTLTF